MQHFLSVVRQPPAAQYQEQQLQQTLQQHSFSEISSDFAQGTTAGSPRTLPMLPSWVIPLELFHNMGTTKHKQLARAVSMQDTQHTCLRFAAGSQQVTNLSKVISQAYLGNPVLQQLMHLNQLQAVGVPLSAFQIL